MMLTSQSFSKLAQRISKAATDLCNGKLVLTHEGGYAPHMVPFHCLAVLEELSGNCTDVIDPYSFSAEVALKQKLLPHQDEAVGNAETLLNFLPV